MKKLWVLDTDHLTLMQFGGVEGTRITGRVASLAKDDYGTSIVSYSEQIKGRLKNIHDAQNEPDKLVVAYRWMRDTLRFFTNIAVWDFDERAAALFVRIRKIKPRMGTQDARIAAIALANDATMVTRNRRDFENIPGLRVEDWSVATDE